MRPLSNLLIERLLAHIESELPKEACGAFFRDEQTDQTILQPYANMADDPIHEFLIDPVEYWQSKLIYGRHAAALYHSHPTTGPALSLKDMRLMDALERCGIMAPMIVVGLKPTIEIRCYQWHAHGYRVLWSCKMLWSCKTATLKEVPV